MSRIVRAALTQTVNAFRDMPATLDGLPALADRLEQIRDANVAHHLELLARAVALDVQVICFGELFTGPYFALHEHAMWHGLAEDALRGPTVTAVREAAAAHGVIVVAPIYELDAGSGMRFNTAVLVDEGGTVLGRYRKTHIPQGSNERAGFHERFYYEPSDGRLGEMPANVSSNPHFPVFETSVGRLAVATCYDRHFPGVAATLAAQRAELVFSPAVTFGEKSRVMWELEFPVDAARYRMFIGGSNRLGSEPPWNVEFFGAGYFVGPGGRVRPIEAAGELVVADLDLDELTGPDASGWDIERDARPDIYG